MANSPETTKLRDSTSVLPMVDLETAINFVAAIRDKAVETAPMPSVAQALNYAAATSTPFYRRITAARLFNLLSQKSALTQQAIDYIKSHVEGAKTAVLVNAILGIAPYFELVNRYAGRKLNTGLVANGLAKEFNLTDACALICAKAFESSLVFAGMIGPDGIVLAVSSKQPEAKNGDGASTTGNQAREAPPPPPPAKAGTQEHTLFLDKEKSRSFTFTGPLEISGAEYARICKWLEFTMLIVDEKKENQT